MNNEPTSNPDSKPSKTSDNPSPFDSVLTRRSFLGHVGKIIALGSLAHFTLLGSKALANDQCCFGADGNDQCTATDTDDCPSGSVTDDKCVSGATADDVCGSGTAPDDACSPTGGGDAGDACPGGGEFIGGNPQDTCFEGLGDECTGGAVWAPGADACDESTEDICELWNDDVCYKGINGPIGGEDTCEATWATDGCFDGSKEQDKCESWSDDTCLGGHTDICDPSIGDQDECPPGCDQANDRCAAQPDACHPYGGTPD